MEEIMAKLNRSKQQVIDDALHGKDEETHKDEGKKNHKHEHDKNYKDENKKAHSSTHHIHNLAHILKEFRDSHKEMKNSIIKTLDEFFEESPKEHHTSLKKLKKHIVEHVDDHHNTVETALQTTSKNNAETLKV